MKLPMVSLQISSYPRTWTHLCCSRSGHTNLNGEDFNIDIIKEDLANDDGSETLVQGIYGRSETKDIDIEVLNEDEDVLGYSGQGAYTGRPEKDHERDPEVADILGSLLDDPQKAQSRMEDRLRKKRNKILHTKMGSGVPMKVSVNKFDFSNSYIWLEFYNAPLEKDISLICDTIRSWHIVGRLGGCNSMNMQLSQSPMEKRPSYDFIQGANVTPTTFYNIGDLEVQDNVARIWCSTSCIVFPR
ncbi:hypothetical protein PIB30_038648 [Stylosanthes scabra]|uniref:Uncharacterized protein n=1 Tax=Stylosanthes scabra TaxID=79078 RepID=A0ABU6WC72_9FABA|nr:hypothetical protein [Stylosanthes scabra]